jgi:homoserine O-acetyltransferase
MKKISFIILLVVISSTTVLSQNELHFANLGNFKTIEGKTIRNCKLGYRTFGKLNKDKSNVVLWTTWFTGTTADIVNFGILSSTMDTTDLYIVAVDALTNGVSSSPSNSYNFPKVTILDMVNSEYQFLTQHLSILHVKGIMGFSMGAFQALQWSITYPRFMDKIISIAGTPKQSFYDLLLWNTQINIIKNAGKDPHQLSFAMERAKDIFTMNLYTPSYYAETNNPDSLASYMTEQYKKQNMTPSDYLAGLNALIGQNIYVNKDGTPNKLNELIKAKVLLITTTQDHMVNSAGSVTLAKELNAPIVILESNCGHLAILCEADKIKKAVKDFL